MKLSIDILQIVCLSSATFLSVYVFLWIRNSKKQESQARAEMEEAHKQFLQTMTRIAESVNEDVQETKRLM